MGGIGGGVRSVRGRPVGRRRPRRLAAQPALAQAFEVRRARLVLVETIIKGVVELRQVKMFRALGVRAVQERAMMFVVRHATHPVRNSLRARKIIGTRRRES